MKSPDGEKQLIKVKKSEVSQGITKATQNPPIVINYKLLSLGILLSLISTGLYYYYPSSSNLIMKVFPFAVAFLGGYLVACQLFQNENPIGKSKSRILVSFLFAIGTLILAEKYFGTSLEISEKSPTAKAIINSVDFHDAMRIRRQNIDAYWTHDYLFYVDGKEYSGYHQSDNSEYKIGDTVVIQYLEDKPQFNKLYHKPEIVK